MKAEDIIDEILKTTKDNSQKYDGNIYSFKYHGNIKSENDYCKLPTNPGITIEGQENIKKYNQLFADLAKEIKVDKKLLLKSFMDLTQNLISEGKFNVPEIIELCNSLEEKEVIYVTKIYGLAMRKESIEYGTFIFVRKDKITEFIRKSNHLPKIKDFNPITEGLKNQEKEKTNFVFVLKKCKGVDLNFLRVECDQTIKHIVKVIRYIIGIKNERVYVDYIPSGSFNTMSYVLSSDGSATTNSSYHFKDIPAYIDEEYVFSKENGNFYLWQLISSNENDEFHKRILEAVIWIGKSLDEFDINLVIAEIAFAFETMLHQEDETFVSKSITAGLSEAYAFINGNTFTERIELAKEFKDFYRRRSTIAHGNRLTKNTDNSYEKYYKMIYQTIKNLLTNDDYKLCKDLKEF